MRLTEVIHLVMSAKSGVTLVHVATATLFIPDVTDEGEFYGFQVASLTMEDRFEIAEQCVTPTEYALAKYPAPGTLAPDRLGFIGVGAMELTEFFSKYEDGAFVTEDEWEG